MKIGDTVYYENELTDDFAGADFKPVTVDETYPFRPRGIRRFFSILVYRGIMKPIAFLWCRLKFCLRMENKEVLRPYHDTGYFVYHNHTLFGGDAFIPNLLDFSKKTSVIVHADNLANPATAPLVRLCGGLPLPTALRGMRPFQAAVDEAVACGESVSVYPEAHVWPYYTGIRPFPDTSFAYPVRCKTPAFAATVTYQKKKHGKTPRITVYIDGPFFPPEGTDPRTARRAVRDAVYTAMCRRALLSTYTPICYCKREEKERD